MSDRMALIDAFLQQKLNESFTVTAISGDASFRQYFRVTGNTGRWILMDAPPVAADIERFVATAKALADAGIRVPKVLAGEASLGLLLLEDLGDDLLQFRLKADNARDWYQKALSLLPAMQSVQQTSQGTLPCFDGEFIMRELSIFTEWCCEVHLALPNKTVWQPLLATTFESIAAQVMAQPQAGMHRDFHSRNLMILKDESLAVIDFQDAVIGPLSYDCVSLLRDCYLRWPDQLVTHLVEDAFAVIRPQSYCPANYNLEQFKQDFDWTGLQRHIKVLGIFCRLYHRDGKAGYLPDLPRVAGYVADISGRYAELSAFHQWFVSTVQPALLEAAA